MPDADAVDHGTICRDAYRYSSHPHLTVAGDGDVVVVFNQSVRRRFIFHPPHDPEYRNLVTRSADMGRSWSAAQVVPDYRYSGTECAGLTTLSSGRMLLNQWQSRWYPLDLAVAGVPEPVELPEAFARELVLSGELETGGQIGDAPRRFAPWARGHGTSFVHASEDGGRAFMQTVALDTGQFHGGYGLRGCVELPDGTLILPLNDIPDFCTIFTVRSRDGGLSWAEPRLVARAPGRLFTEAAMVLTAAGDLLCLMRDDTTRIMHSCRSADAGHTWTAPQATGIDGYPPHLLRIGARRLLCTYGMRLPEYSIRAVVSDDDGRSWQIGDPVMIRRRLPNRDLGYPSTALLADGSLLTVYYCEDAAGVTGVDYTRWTL